MINPENVLTYDQLFLRCKQLEAEVEQAKLVVLEANMQVIRAKNMLLAKGNLAAYGLQPVTFGAGDNLAGGAV